MIYAHMRKNRETCPSLTKLTGYISAFMSDDCSANAGITHDFKDAPFTWGNGLRDNPGLHQVPTGLQKISKNDECSLG